MAKYQVIFFQKENGEAPAEIFIDSLDYKMQAKIFRLLTLISEKGPELREPYSKLLEDGIFELRAKVGSDITRVLYFFFVGQRIIVTNGFVKRHKKRQNRRLIKQRLFVKNTLIERRNDYENVR